jgi:hypothetical protein
MYVFLLGFAFATGKSEASWGILASEVRRALCEGRYAEGPHDLLGTRTQGEWIGVRGLGSVRD